jgi:diguanylate cyclase (GGDEF)-like protein
VAQREDQGTLTPTLAFTRGTSVKRDVPSKIEPAADVDSRLPTDAQLQETLDRRQRLRVQRLLIAVSVYVPCGLLLIVMGWVDLLPMLFAPVWIAVFAATNLAFYAAIRSGVNLRFADPSMTMAQMAVAMVAAALVLYHVQATRGALLMFLLVVLFFGAFELRMRQVFAMGAFASFAYAVVIVMLTINRPAQVDLRVEWIQWIALTATLMVMCPLVGHFSDLRRRLAASLAMIREMANRDALTGVFNRRHLNDTLEREVSRCERKGTPLLLAVVDLDNFKRINDKHGHPAGDAALRAVAQVLLDTLRKADYVARYGGEEFVLLLDVDSVQGARVIGERLLARVEALRVRELGGGVVTVSIGAAFHWRGDNTVTLLARADAALYAAKESGRNRLVIDHEDDSTERAAPAGV